MIPQRNSLVKFFALVLVCVMVFALVPQIQSAEAASVYYVASNGDDNDPGTSESTAFETIGQAVTTATNQSGTGSVKINLLDDNFSECGPFYIDRVNITIQGAGVGETNVEMDTGCTDAFETSAFVINKASGDLNFTLKDLTISGFRFGVRMSYQDDSDYDELTNGIEIQNVDFEDIGREDILTETCDVSEEDFILVPDDGTDGDFAGTFLYDGKIYVEAEDTGTAGEAQSIAIAIGTPGTGGTATDPIITVSSGATTASLVSTIDGLAEFRASEVSSGTITTATSATDLSLGDGAAIFLQNIEEISISNVNITGGSHGIYLENKHQELIDSSVSTVTMEDLTGIGFVMIAQDDNDNVDISNVTVDTPGLCGMTLKNISDTDTDISDITVIEPGEQGVYASDIQDVSFSDISVSDAGAEGMIFTGTNHGTEFSALTIDASVGIGLSVTNNDDFKLIDSLITDGEEEGVNLSDSEDPEISGNTISGNEKEGLILDGTIVDPMIFDNIIHTNGEYGISVGSDVEGGYVYSNTFYANEGDGDHNASDDSDEQDGITWYYNNAAGEYDTGNYWGTFLADDASYDGIADTNQGYLPDNGDNRDIYSRVTTARVDSTMGSTTNYVTYQLDYETNADFALSTVKACYRLSTTTGNYTCVSDSDKVSPIAVTGAAGQTYSVIVVATDIHGNGESDPNSSDTPEFTIALSGSASGTEPVTVTDPDPIDPDPIDPDPIDPVEEATVAPSKPADLAVAPASSTQLLLTWSGNNPVDAVSSYKIYRSTDNTNFSFLTSTSVPRYLNSSLTTATTYYYKIRAMNNIGESVDSLSVSGQPTTPVINQTALSNVVLITTAAQTTVATSSDSKARLIVTPDSVKEVTHNNTTAVVFQGETNDTNGIAVEAPLFNPSYAFVSPNVYTFSATDINATDGEDILGEYNIVEIKYTNSDAAVISEDNLALAVFNDTTDTWTPLFTTIDPNANVARAMTRQLGRFAIVAHSSPRSYSDVFTTSPFINFIGNLTKAGVVSGQGGKFSGDNDASRGEQLKIVMRSLGYYIPSFANTSACPDMTTSDPFTPYFNKAIEEGIITGYSDGSCKPNARVTRGEAMKITMGAIDARAKTYTGSFTFSDLNTTDPGFRPYIAYAKDNGFVSGNTDGTFGTNRRITRNEISKIVSNAVTSKVR